MEIVTPTGDSNVFVIPRNTNDYIDVRFRNVSTDKSVTVTEMTYVVSDNKLQFFFTEDVKQQLVIEEGQFVNVEVIGYDEESLEQKHLLYRGRIFVTTQTIDQKINEVYDINEGQYTENESENEYIIF